LSQEAKVAKAKKSKNTLPKLIERYYADLAEFARQNVLFEMGTRHAFHRLMADAGKEYRWTLIAEQEKKVGSKTIRPDGTFKDEMNLVRGFWEAKDTADKLEAEIEKKRKAGYPLSNIIFEDTKTAILYQNGQRILAVEMQDSAKLAELITQFFRYVEPEIEEFEHAVDEFKERVPDLADGLRKKIEQAHRTNPAFKRAFADFFELCKTSLNPNIAQAAVDEMLIQHILTERLIREIFDNPEFVRRNVIAAEVEKVMLAMTSHSFDRNTYLRDLDRFYVAIEHAARTMTDWSDKQYFLNTVYERFFQGYSVKLADTMGIVYTPQAIVNFMCASVAEVLEKEFGKKLWSDDVYIIDPCTGTGNFIVNLIRRIPKAKLEDAYKHRMFANEIMLLPYYIAALNIEHTYSEQMERYEAFEGLCFVDTLDIGGIQQKLRSFTEENTKRVRRQELAPITVVVGNPPYNVGQKTENLNNKNRKYADVDDRIRETYARDSGATLLNKLYDPYVRFWRWATDRLGKRDGVICFVSNNNFLDQHTFVGMRRHLFQDFSRIYHIDLHGNVRLNPKLSGTTHNVFGIQIGVGITIAIKNSKLKKKAVLHHRVAENLRREEKLSLLDQATSIGGVAWETLRPDNRGNWFTSENDDQYQSFAPIGNKLAKKGSTASAESVFATYSTGVNTGRDSVVYGHNKDNLLQEMNEFAEAYNGEIDRYARADAPEDIDNFFRYDRIKWSRNLKRDAVEGKSLKVDSKRARRALYRPFVEMWLYFSDVAVDEMGKFPRLFPNDADNVVIALSDRGYRAPAPSALVSRTLQDYHLCASSDAHQCFPFYVYDEDGTNRRENITDWALKQFRDHYKDKKIDKWAIFHYVYGLLHHGGYRQKYEGNLKRELPRIPFAPEFRPFARAGEKLARLHLDYEKLKPWDLDFSETPGIPLSYRVEDKMRLSKDKLRLTVNPSLTLSGIPAETFEYRLGNRSALEWVIDQYQVSTDKRSGIVSDPNREDDPQYIVRLVGQVIRVSLETVQIVKDLPAEFEPK
jgi:predicted helicase